MVWLYGPVKKIEEMFICFDRIHERDRRTPHDDMGHAYAQHRAAKIVNAAGKAKAKAWIFDAKATGPEAKAIKMWPQGQGVASRITLVVIGYSSACGKLYLYTKWVVL